MRVQNINPSVSFGKFASPDAKVKAAELLEKDWRGATTINKDRLKDLEEADFVTFRTEGSALYCEINQDKFQKALDLATSNGRATGQHYISTGRLKGKLSAFVLAGVAHAIETMNSKREYVDEKYRQRTEIELYRAQ